MITRTSKSAFIALCAISLFRLPAAHGQVVATANDAPQGIEVQSRGPIHEAFASLTADPEPSKPIAKQPPKPAK